MSDPVADTIQALVFADLYQREQVNVAYRESKVARAQFLTQVAFEEACADLEEQL